MKPTFTRTASAVMFLLLAQFAQAADIVETATTSGTFKKFLAAAETAGMTDKLKNSGPYTVFAPSDSAFNKLPEETVNALLKDKNKAQELLAHLVIPGKVTVSDVKPGKVETIQGDTLTLKSDNGKITVDNNANVIQSDVMADNGIIHEIDEVVMPAR